VSKNGDGMCDKLGGIPMSLFKALDFGETILFYFFPSLHVKR